MREERACERERARERASERASERESERGRERARERASEMAVSVYAYAQAFTGYAYVYLICIRVPTLPQGEQMEGGEVWVENVSFDHGGRRGGVDAVRGMFWR